MRDIPALADREELETSSANARTPLQPAIVTPKQALSIKPFGLNMDVLLTTEATGGATSAIMALPNPRPGPSRPRPCQRGSDLVHHRGPLWGDRRRRDCPGRSRQQRLHPAQQRASLQERRIRHGTHAGLEPAWWAGPFPQSYLGACGR